MGKKKKKQAFKQPYQARLQYLPEIASRHHGECEVLMQLRSWILAEARAWFPSQEPTKVT